VVCRTKLAGGTQLWAYLTERKKENNIQIDTSKLKINENAAFGQVLPPWDFGKEDTFGSDDSNNGFSSDNFGKDGHDNSDSLLDKEHREKCEELRKIRKSMAKTLGVPELVRDEQCNYEGHCSGTCPACYKEERALMDRIYELHENGVIDMIYGDDIKDLQRRAEEYNKDDDDEFMGSIDYGPNEFDM
jgi:hypothetical protein